jgi:hypothetical protein
LRLVAGGFVIRDELKHGNENRRELNRVKRARTR